MGLEVDFKGEKYWKEYSNSYNQEIVENHLLLLLEGKTDIAKVIFYHLKGESVNWLNSSVPALEGLTPLECLKNETLTNRLKACLMRMH